MVPLFQKLIKEKATELPITDFRMTRFWITLDQGINFVLSCLKIMQGGEIFIPKIPSMRITDLAQSMAPDLLHREIGIRAGEKLHELMISEDDARNSFEFADRYAIHTFSKSEKSIYERQAEELVRSGFSYASETNAEWLTPEDFKSLSKFNLLYLSKNRSSMAIWVIPLITLLLQSVFLEEVMSQCNFRYL